MWTRTIEKNDIYWKPTTAIDGLESSPGCGCVTSTPQESKRHCELFNQVMFLTCKKTSETQKSII